MLTLPKQTLVYRRQYDTEFITCLNIHIDLPLYAGCYDVTPDFLNLEDVEVLIRVRSGNLQNSQTFLLSATISAYKVIYELRPTEGVLLLQAGSTPFEGCAFELEFGTDVDLSLANPLPCAADVADCTRVYGRLDVLSQSTNPNTLEYSSITAASVFVVNTSVGC